MAKKWYQFLVTRDGGAASPSGDGAAAPAGPSVSEIAAQVPAEMPLSEDLSGTPTFDEIYEAARIAPPSHGYSILKVADMLRSEHIASLPADVKRKSVLLALDAAGVPIADIIEDAVRRDRALDTFERTQQKALEALEARVHADSARLQEEIEKLIAERQAKIRTANDELAQETAAVRAWRERKRAEETRIAEAVGHFVSENPITFEPQTDTPPAQ